MQYAHTSRIVNLRHLRTFVAIAEAGGVGRALGRLHLSQPAVSRQVAALEEELGLQLFERAGRGVRLTAHGEELLRHSRMVLNQADSLRERAQALRSGRAGVLRIGASPQFMEDPLAPWLARFRRDFPEIDVHLVEDGGARLPRRLVDGDVHLAMLALRDDRFRTLPLFPVYLLAVVAAAHPLGRRRTIEVVGLGDSPLMVGSGFASRVWFQGACTSARLKPNIVLESGAPHTMVALAGSGFAIAVVPSNVALNHEGVRAVPLVHAGRPIGHWMAAAWNPERFLPPYAGKFVAGLAAHCRREYPGRTIVRRAPPLPRED